MNETKVTLSVKVIIYDGTVEQAVQAIKDWPATFSLPGGGEVEIVGAEVAGA